MDIHRNQYTSILFLLLFSYLLHQAIAIALPIGPQTPTNSLTQPGPIHNISASNDLTVEQNVQNLVRKLAGWRETRWTESRLLSITLTVDESDSLHPTLSANIAAFRKIKCLFWFGGQPVPFSFLADNQWPDHWDIWNSPRPAPRRPTLAPVNWQRMFLRMSVEWADTLLKLRGYRGRYGAVVLLQVLGGRLGWCFKHVELEGGWFVDMIVTVNGEVYESGNCEVVLIVAVCVGNALTVPNEGALVNAAVPLQNNSLLESQNHVGNPNDLQIDCDRSRYGSGLRYSSCLDAFRTFQHGATQNPVQIRRRGEGQGQAARNLPWMWVSGMQN
ncbi:MAG: hypothetical protein Q9169_007353 [Polycauliona sp. 2 TL-2023]